MRRKREDSSAVMNVDTTPVESQLKQQAPRRNKKIVAFVSAGSETGAETSPAVSPLTDWFMQGLDDAVLLKYRKSDLVDRCAARGVPVDGSKQDLIDGLLHWKKHALPPGALDSSGSIPDLAQLRLMSPASTQKSPSLDDELAEVDSGYVTELPSMNDIDSQGVIPFAEIKIGKKIGSGAYKTVHRGIFRKCIVAVAVISTEKLSKDDLADIENEVQLLRDLRHDNIVRFIGYSREDLGTIHILTEFCPFGDLSDYMKSKAKPGWSRQLAVLHDIAFGVSYLHDRRPAIIHRDLKSLNILIDSSERAKIADFGLSKTRSKIRAKMHTVVGTINWQAPEMWHDQPTYNEKVDVYSCGLIFWEVLNWSNIFPFGELSDAQIHERVGKQGLRPPLTSMRRYPKEILTIMQDMWSSNPEERPSMSVVLAKLTEMME